MTHSIQDLAVAMLKCEQTKGQTVYQHGISVQEHFNDLLNDPVEFKLPTWFEDYRKEIINSLHPQEIIQQYTLYHDVGKPFCKVTDESGSSHFPNHAGVSKNVWLSAGGDPVVGNLIGCDMDIHTLTSEDIKLKCEQWSVKDACTLLLASLAEIHSNAKLFGGQNSPSFKMKFKTIERRGKQICKHYFP